MHYETLYEIFCTRSRDVARFSAAGAIKIQQSSPPSQKLNKNKSYGRFWGYKSKLITLGLAL
jgi:hypothetical protein